MLVSELQFQAIRAAGFAGAVIAAAALQRAWPHSRVVGSRRTNFFLWAVNLVVMGIACGACACAASRWAAHQGIGLLNNHLADMPSWGALLVTIPALDLVSYAWHRANHTLPVLWRFHQVHHSDIEFTASTALRFHPGELLLSLPIRLGAIVALGVPVAGVIAFELVFAVANLIEHGNIDLPRRLERLVERLCVTPALHRRHHGKPPRLVHSNFGTVFSLWDRLLGTFGPSTSAERFEIGLADIPGPVGPRRALVLPLGRARIPSAG